MYIYIYVKDKQRKENRIVYIPCWLGIIET